MWTQTPEGRKLVQEISKDIVVEIAPEEMDLFDELIMEYFQDPTPPNLSAKPKDDPLGFGLGEVLIAATPAVAAMVDVVLNYLINESIKAAQGESAEFIKRKIKGLFNPEKKEEKTSKTGQDDVEPLTKEQLEQVKKLARKQAIKFGIGSDKAEKMANALIGSLALTK
jgi:hypothetical protein